MTAGMGSHAGKPPSFFRLSLQARTRSAVPGDEERRRRQRRHRRVGAPVVDRGKAEGVAEQRREPDRGEDRAGHGLGEQALPGPLLGDPPENREAGEQDAEDRHDRPAARIHRVDQQEVAGEQLVDPQVRSRRIPPPRSAGPTSHGHEGGPRGVLDPELAAEEGDADRQEAEALVHLDRRRCQARERLDQRVDVEQPPDEGRWPITTRTAASASDARSAQDRRGNVVTLSIRPGTTLRVPIRSGQCVSAAGFTPMPAPPRLADPPVREGDSRAGTAQGRRPLGPPSGRPRAQQVERAVGQVPGRLVDAAAELHAEDRRDRGRRGR